MHAIMALSQRIVVLHHGEKIAEGAPGDGRARPAGGRGLPGRGAREPAASWPASTSRYGDLPALPRCRPRGRGGRDAVGGRGQRGGEDDHAAHHLRAAARRAAARSASRASASTGWPCHRGGRARAWCTCRRGARCSPAWRCARTSSSAPTRARPRRGAADSLERVFAMFPRLRERLGQAAGTLSGGEQQMLAIGRALMALPKLLMLDEPSLGLAPLIVRRSSTRSARSTGGHHGAAGRAEHARRRWRARAAATCWRTAAWCWWARARSCWATSTCAGRILACEAEEPT